MTLAGVLLRFVAAYVLLLLAAVLVLRILGVEGQGGVNMAVLIGAVAWPCLLFARRNGRTFTRAEKLRVVLGMAAIDLLLQAALSWAALASAPQPLTVGPLVLAFVFIALLHLAAIAWFVELSARLWTKQQARRAAAGPTRPPDA